MRQYYVAYINHYFGFAVKYTLNCFTPFGGYEFLISDYF